MFEISKKEISDYSGGEIPDFSQTENDNQEAITFESAANEKSSLQEKIGTNENVQTIFQLHQQ